MSRLILVLTLAFLTIAAVHPASEAAALPTPPQQPASGPSGAAVRYPKVIASQHGDEPRGYWLFEPSADGSTPVSETQPLVIFLHGFGAVDPQGYRPWIDHIVERGAVVVYPFYQGGGLRLHPASHYTEDAATAVKDAVALLAAGEHTPVDTARTSVVGHSEGGVLTANYAATAAGYGVPVPSAIMLVEPGGCLGCDTPRGGGSRGPELADLSAIAGTTRALVVVGDDDNVAGQTPAKIIWAKMTSVPLAQRDYIVVQSDDHGQPTLVANHFFPIGAGRFGALDALDWYGTWRLFDALTACTFDHHFCDQALGGGDAQRAMGVWSDGTPVAPLLVTDTP